MSFLKINKGKLSTAISNAETYIANIQNFKTAVSSFLSNECNLDSNQIMHTETEDTDGDGHKDTIIQDKTYNYNPQWDQFKAGKTKCNDALARIDDEVITPLTTIKDAFVAVQGLMDAFDGKTASLKEFLDGYTDDKKIVNGEESFFYVEEIENADGTTSEQLKFTWVDGEGNKFEITIAEMVNAFYTEVGMTMNSMVVAGMFAESNGMSTLSAEQQKNVLDNVNSFVDKALAVHAFGVASQEDIDAVVANAESKGYTMYGIDDIGNAIAGYDQLGDQALISAASSVGMFALGAYSLTDSLDKFGGTKVEKEEDTEEDEKCSKCGKKPCECGDKSAEEESANNGSEGDESNGDKSEDGTGEDWTNLGGGSGDGSGGGSGGGGNNSGGGSGGGGNNSGGGGNNSGGGTSSGGGTGSGDGNGSGTSNGSGEGTGSGDGNNSGTGDNSGTGTGAGTTDAEVKIELPTEEDVPEAYEEVAVTSEDIDAMAKEKYYEQFESEEAFLESRAEDVEKFNELFSQDDRTELINEFEEMGYTESEIEAALSNEDVALTAYLLGKQNQETAQIAMDLAKENNIQNFDTVYDDTPDFDDLTDGQAVAELTNLNENATVKAAKTAYDDAQTKYVEAVNTANSSIEAANAAEEKMEQVLAEVHKTSGADICDWSQEQIDKVNAATKEYNAAVEKANADYEIAKQSKVTYDETKVKYNEEKTNYYNKIVEDNKKDLDLDASNGIGDGQGQEDISDENFSDEVFIDMLN